MIICHVQSIPKWYSLFLSFYFSQVQSLPVYPEHFRPCDIPEYAEPVVLAYVWLGSLTLSPTGPMTANRRISYYYDRMSGLQRSMARELTICLQYSGCGLVYIWAGSSNEASSNAGYT